MFHRIFLLITKAQFIRYLVTLNSIVHTEGTEMRRAQTLSSIPGRYSLEQTGVLPGAKCSIKRSHSDSEIKLPGNQYTFAIERFHVIQKKIESNRKRIRDHYFHLLGPIARKRLCGEVKYFASLDGFTKDTIDLPDEYSIVLTDKKTIEFSVAIACPTIPPTYVLDRESNHELTIMMKENRYDKGVYKFKLKKLKSLPWSASDEEEDVKKNFLSNLLGDNRLWLCVTAKKSISTDVSIQFINSKVKKAQVLIIEYKPNQREKKIVIQCPSLPVMYVSLAKADNMIDVAVLETAAYELGMR